MYASKLDNRKPNALGKPLSIKRTTFRMLLPTSTIECHPAACDGFFGFGLGTTEKQDPIEEQVEALTQISRRKPR